MQVAAVAWSNARQRVNKRRTIEALPPAQVNIDAVSASEGSLLLQWTATSLALEQAQLLDGGDVADFDVMIDFSQDDHPASQLDPQPLQQHRPLSPPSPRCRAFRRQPSHRRQSMVSSRLQLAR